MKNNHRCKHSFLGSELVKGPSGGIIKKDSCWGCSHPENETCRCQVEVSDKSVKKVSCARISGKEEN